MKVSIAQEKLDVKSLNYVFSHINLDILCKPYFDCLRNLSLYILIITFHYESLKKLDKVIAVIHMGFKRNITERILAAMENPFVTIIAHLSGRLVSRRIGYEVDLEKILQGAKKRGKALERKAL